MEGIFCTKVNVDLISTKKKGRTIYVDHGNKPLILKTPRFSIPFSLGEKKTKDGRVFMKTITFSMKHLSGEDDDKNNRHISKFEKKLQEIDEKLSSCLPECDGYTFYNSLYTGNEKYASTFKANIKFEYNSDGVYILDLFDRDNKLIAAENVMFEKTVCSSVVKLDSIWVNHDTKKMGVNWTVSQVKMY